MLVRSRKPWDVIDHRVTDEALAMDRRKALGVLAGGAVMLGGMRHARAEDAPIAAELYPAKHDAAFTIDRPLTDESIATTYNNFYEFGSGKSIWEDAQALRLRPWMVKVDGLVDQKLELDVEELIRRMPLEERLYRHRCVETWSMDVPWTGFPLAALLQQVKPTGDAKYVRFETFYDPDQAPGQQAAWYPWPYVEGVTIAEAMNDLCFIATGLYGKPLAKQNGAPVRLVTPWKYGFKSAKSIQHITLTKDRPVGYWEAIGQGEYGFWANVNPEVPHPRWSQAQERPLGANATVPTRLFNGYGDFVASLYKGLEGEALYT